MNEPFLDIAMDGGAHPWQPPIAVKTLVIVNGSSANLTVTDDVGRSFTIGAGDGGPIPVPPSRGWTFQSAGPAAGACWVFASDKRLPGATGGLTAAGGGGATGGQANLWNAAAVGIGGNSTAFLVPAEARAVAVFGHVSAATTLSLQVSADGANYYTVATSNPTGDFAFSNLGLAGVWLRLQSSAAVTITATAVAA